MLTLFYQFFKLNLQLFGVSTFFDRQGHQDFFFKLFIMRKKVNSFFIILLFNECFKGLYIV